MKNNLIIFLSVLAVAAASCTSCRVTKDLHRSSVDSTAYYRDQSIRLKDSLSWLDSVHTETVKSWLEFGAVFQEECPPCPDTSAGGGLRDHHTGPSVDPRDFLPITRVETKPDGSTIFQTNQRLKALNLNYSTLAIRYDSVSKASQLKDSTIMDLEKKVELFKKEKMVNIKKEWRPEWWVWLILVCAGILLAFIMIRHFKKAAEKSLFI